MIPVSAAKNRITMEMIETKMGLRYLCSCLLILGTMGSAVSSDDKKPEEQTRDEKLAAARFELMQKRVLAARAQADEPGFPEQFNPKPIFRYSDQARGHVSAAVWVLGNEGRPKALLASELDRINQGRPVISYEYISFTKTPFSLKGDDIRWTPTTTLIDFKPIAKAPVPADTAARRLIQLREIGKRFAAHETVGNEKCELRLLPQPALRYVPSKAENADGAIFFFTFGTNPEIVMLLESDGKAWNYAVNRMTGAEVVELTFDGTVIWSGPPLQHGLTSPSTGDVFSIDIPGVDKSGREIRE
jgi:hypothetical protein